MATDRFTMPILIGDVIKGSSHFGRKHQLFNNALGLHNFHEFGSTSTERATPGKSLTRQ